MGIRRGLYFFAPRQKNHALRKTKVQKRFFNAYWDSAENGRVLGSGAQETAGISLPKDPGLSALRSGMAVRPKEINLPVLPRFNGNVALVFLHIICENTSMKTGKIS